MLSGKCLGLALEWSHRDRSLELSGEMIAGMARLMKAYFEHFGPYFSSRRDNTQMRSEIGTISWICHRLTVPIGQSRRILVFEVIQFSYIYLRSQDWTPACCCQTQLIYHPLANFHQWNNCCSRFLHWLPQFYCSTRSLSPRCRQSTNYIRSIS